MKSKPFSKRYFHKKSLLLRVYDEISHPRRIHYSTKGLLLVFLALIAFSIPLFFSNQVPISSLSKRFLDPRGCVSPCEGSILVGSQQNLFLDQFSTDANSWQLSNFGSTCNAAYTNQMFGIIGGLKGIQLNSNSTCRSFALSKSFLDMSNTANREMIFRFRFSLQFGGSYPNQWLIYFTRNGTISNNSQYSPFTDKQVALIERASNIQDWIVWIQKDASRSIQDESAPTTCPIAQQKQDEFTCQTNPTTWATNTLSSYIDTVLNYTGNTNGVNAGSYTEANVLGGCSPCATQRNSGDTPWLNIEEKYYIGYWNQGGNSPIGISESFFAFATAWIPPPSTPAADTSGFFGPLIRFFIQLFVIGFQYLSGFLSAIANLFVTALDTVGSFLGFGAIGTALKNTLIGVSTFVSNVLGGIINQFVNAVTFIGNFTSAIFSALSPYWTRISNFVDAILGVLGFLGTVLNDLFSIGALSASALLFIDYTWGLYQVYENGTEGFSKWLDFNEMFFFRLGKSMYFLIFHGWDVGLRIKNTVVNWI